MTVSTDTEKKIFIKFNNYSYFENSQKARNSRKFPQFDKGYLQKKSTANIIFNCKRLNAFSLRSYTGKDVCKDVCSHYCSSTVIYPAQ